MMRSTIWIGRAEKTCTMLCGAHVLDHMPPCRLIVTDSNVYAHYRPLLQEYGIPVHVLPAGEEHKNMAELTRLLSAMAAAGVCRSDRIACVGGGVVGDLGGLAAALYMRGVGCIQVPTTLLAQVDAAIGGKTAIDFEGVKNLVGAFHFPEQVLADSRFLHTLAPREIKCGLGEMVKHAALCGELFEALSAHTGELCDIGFLSTLIPMNMALKAEIVCSDPEEQGRRRCLNLGHTTGHALEACDMTRSHGECVLVGLLLETAIARRYCACDRAYLAEYEALVRRALGQVPPLPPVGELARGVRLDKKNARAEEVTLVVPVRKGEYALLALPVAEYLRALEEAERS